MAPRTLNSYDVVWPRGEKKQGRQPLAKRLDSLNGKTVALLWDYLFFGDKVFATLQEELRRRFPGVRFIGWSEFGNTHSSNEHEVLASLPRRFKELGVNAAISGMGC